jgi:hypothetical protein
MFSETILRDWDPAPFRDALVRAGYTRKDLEAADLHRPGDPVARTHLAPKLLAADSPMLAACRLFDLGEPVGGKAAMSLFGADLLGLMRIGLLEALGNDLCAPPPSWMPMSTAGSPTITPRRSSPASRTT